MAVMPSRSRDWKNHTHCIKAFIDKNVHVKEESQITDETFNILQEKSQERFMSLASLCKQIPNRSIQSRIYDGLHVNDGDRIENMAFSKCWSEFVVFQLRRYEDHLFERKK